MNRISTTSSYLSVIANLNDAQLRQIRAGNEVSSQKKAQDLKGYAHQAETLTAMQSLRARVGGYIDQADVLADRFQAQDTALSSLAESVAGMRQAITDALASGRADTLMQELRGFFGDAVAALNTKSQGKYLFSGGQLTTPPVSATGLADLTAAPTLASLFHNDQFKPSNQLDESTTIQGSFLADALGTSMFQSLQTIEAFNEGPTGNMTGALNQTQKDFLQAQLSGLDDVHDSLVNNAALNGSYQRRIDDTKNDLKGRATTLDNMIGGVTDVDVAQAISRLQQAQVAVQASAQVFQGLQSSSLLNYLKF